MRSAKSGSAATLVAVVLVMAVGGIMIGVKMAGQYGSDRNAKIRETQRRMDFVHRRYQQFAAEHGYLAGPGPTNFPIPDPSRPNQNDQYWGVSAYPWTDTDPTHLPKLSIPPDKATGQIISGGVPLATLHISDPIYGYDAWGNMLVVRMTKKAADETTCKTLQNDVAKGSTEDLVNVQDESGAIKDRVMYVVESMGEDSNYAVPMQGSDFDHRIVRGPGDNDTQTNGMPDANSITNVVVQKSPTSTFDDIVTYPAAYKRKCCLKPSCLAPPQAALGARFTGQSPYNIAAWDLAVGDVNGDGIDDVVIGAPFENAVYVIYGTMNGFPKTIPLGGLDGTNGFVIRNPGGHLFGYSVTVADVDGDGIMDIGIGDPNPLTSQNVCPSPLANKAYVIKGSTSFPKVLTFVPIGGAWWPPGTTGFAFGAPNLPPNFGYNVLLSDINKDGIADFCVSSLNDVRCMYGHGGAFPIAPAYVDANALQGASSGFKVTADANITADPSHPAPPTGTQNFAPSLAAGDVNKDGIKDLILGASQVTPPTGQVRAGAVYVIFGRDRVYPDEVKLETLNGNTGTRIDGVITGEKMGSAVAAGDVNHDGYADIIAGANYANIKLTYNSSGNKFSYTGAPGRVYVIYGKPSWSSYMSVGSLNSASGLIVDGASLGDGFGAALATTDVNGDGITDIIVGAPTEGASGEGGGYVVYGRDHITNPFPAAMDVTSPDGTTVAHYFGSYPGQNVGWAVAGGNLNNVNGKDIAIASPFANFGGGVDSGGGYLLFGPLTGFNINLNSM